MLNKLKNVRIPVRVTVALALMALLAMSAMPAFAKWCELGLTC